MTYTWQIVGIRKKQINETPNTITEVVWMKIGTDENQKSGSFMGTTELPTPDPNNFISYETLTEEVVLGWVQSIGAGASEESINSIINEQIEQSNNPLIESTELPWS